MKVELYERSYEQNDELGLNDMNTENYMNQGNFTNNGNSSSRLLRPPPYRATPAAVSKKEREICCANARLLEHLSRSGRHLITRDTPPGPSCHTSPVLQPPPSGRNTRRGSKRSRSGGVPSPALSTRTPRPPHSAVQMQTSSRSGSMECPEALPPARTRSASPDVAGKQ